mgnify:CR=1 FL=1
MKSKATNINIQTSQVNIATLQRTTLFSESNWSDLKKSRLIESILVGIPIGMIWINLEISKIIDGNKRLDAIRSFMTNEFPLQHLTFELPDLEGLFYYQMPPYLQRRIEETILTVVKIQHGTPSTELKDIINRIK